MKIQKKDDGGDFVDINNCGMYTVNHVQCFDSEDPQSLDGSLYVDIEILVDNIFDNRKRVTSRLSFGAGVEESKTSITKIVEPEYP